MKTEISFFDAYRFDACKECGTCLSGCVNKNIDRKEAIFAVKRLRTNQNVDDLLDDCVSCSLCNHRCPEDALPYALILERLKERRQAEGPMAPSSTYFMNGMIAKGRRRTFFLDIERAQTRVEKQIITHWAEPKKGDDLLLCSCVMRLQPLTIEKSNVLSELVKFGGPDDCCGIRQFKNGYWDEARYVSDRLMERLSQNRFQRLVVPCGACHDMIANRYPKYFGLDLPFKVVSLYEYLNEQLMVGKARVKRQFKQKALVSDACWHMNLGDDYMKLLETMYSLLGIEPERPDHHGLDNLCCGVAKFYQYGSLRDASLFKDRKLADLKVKGVNDVVTYCHGCYLYLNQQKHEFQNHFLLEKVLWALGDSIPDPLSALAVKMKNRHSLASMLLNLPWLLRSSPEAKRRKEIYVGP